MRFFNLLFLNLFCSVLLFANEVTAIYGVSDASKTAIREQIASKRMVLEQMSPDQVTKQMQTICDQVLQPHGYYKATVTIKRHKNGKISLHIRKNQPTLVGSVTVKAPDGNLEKQFQPFIGQRFSFRLYNQMKETLLTHYANRGYIHASIHDSSTNINTKTNKASVHLVVKPGTLFRFGDIIIQDLPYAPSLIKRFANFEKNEPINLEKIDTFRSHLSQSKLFESVSVRTNMQKNPVDVIVSGVAVRSHFYSFGIGANNHSGLNISTSNTFNHLTPYGDQVKSTFTISLDKTSKDHVPLQFHTIYLSPGLNPLTDFFGSQIQISTNQETSDAISDSMITSLFYNRKSKFDSYAASINLLYERQAPKNQERFVTQLFYPKIETHHILSPPHLPYKHLRIRNHIMAGVATEHPTSPFMHFRLGFRGEIPISKDFSLIQDILGGMIFSKNFLTLPTNMRFYAGGPYSLRGYRYKMLGPGKRMLLLSHELFYKINDSYGVSSFVDMGWLAPSQSTKPASSFGVSFNAYLPMGIFQLSAAKPINDNSNNDHVLFQFRLIPSLESLR